MSNERILLVEDDPAVSDAISCALRMDGYRITLAKDGVEAIALARENPPNIIILDLILPKLSGFDVCKTIRRDSTIPIIMLSAKADEEDKILGFEMGADDYITKPFSIRELSSRIRAVLRRLEATNSPSHHILQAEGILLDTLRRTATIRGRTTALSPKELDLLRCLMSNPNRVIERKKLFDQVWLDGRVGERTLDVHIRWLRMKIEVNPDRPRLIKTVRGIGYKFATEFPNSQPILEGK
jgi:DNA-binding response OmpR family regulator